MASLDCIERGVEVGVPCCPGLPSQCEYAPLGCTVCIQSRATVKKPCGDLEAPCYPRSMSAHYLYQGLITSAEP